MSDSVNPFTPATLPDLPYPYNALEPIINTELLQIHHGKHHKAYVDGYNKFGAELAQALHNKDHFQAQKLVGKVNFHSGGHNAHSLFWENLAPINNGGGALPAPNSPLSQAIHDHFGSYDKFIDEFNKTCADIQGSGWAWLAMSPLTKALDIKSTEKHDSVTLQGWVPLLTVDVWEHAYYLQYKNLKVDYFKAIWKIINWKVVEARYLKVKGTA